MDRNGQLLPQSLLPDVALRKESVDRNIFDVFLICMKEVALRKESVDRNTNFVCQVCVFCRRSPQGERG